MKLRFAFLIIGMFSIGCSSFMMAALLPEISRDLHVSLELASQGISLFNLAYLVSAPLLTSLLTHYPLKLRLQFSLVLFFLGSLGTVLANTIEMFYLFRILTGIGVGLFNPLCVSLAMEYSRSANKGKSLSLIWGANSAGVVFGVPLAVEISKNYSWHWAILYTVFLGIVVFLGTTFQKSSEEIRAKIKFRERIDVLKDPKVLQILFISFLTTTASLGLYSFVSQIHEKMSSPLSVALFIWGLGGFLGSSLVGSLLDKLKHPQKIMAGILAGLALCFFGLFYFNSNGILLFLFFLWGLLGWATTAPQQYALFEISDQPKSILSALNSAAIGLGGASGTMLGAILLGEVADSKILAFSASGVLGLTLLFQCFLSKNIFERKVLESETSRRYC